MPHLVKPHRSTHLLVPPTCGCHTRRWERIERRTAASACPLEDYPRVERSNAAIRRLKGVLAAVRGQSDADRPPKRRRSVTTPIRSVFTLRRVAPLIRHPSAPDALMLAQKVAPLYQVGPYGSGG
jgi:hypothetical protein